MSKIEKEGIVLKFGEEPNSIAAVLVAYIKENTESKNEAGLIDKIIKVAGIDTSIWRVKEFKLTPNAWGVTMNVKKKVKGEKLLESVPSQGFNYQLKVEIRFERIPVEIEQAFKKFIKDIPTFKYSKRIPKNTDKGKVLLEVAPLDAHLGKLAWQDELIYRNYDTNIAVEDLQYAVDKLLAWSEPHNPSKIIYVLGQDMYHVDNMKGNTTTGDHAMDVDGRITKINELAFKANLRNIYKCRALAPVEVIWVPGNHDFFASHMLAFALKEHFKNDKYVTVDVEPVSRKARLWGKTLVGFTHRIVGKQSTWANELAQAYPELWAKSIFREWHHGDQHKKQTVKTFPVFTNGGVIMRQLTALSPVDRWHFENLYTDAVPGGEGFLWHKDTGVFCNWIAWTGQYDEYRKNLIKTHQNASKSS